MNIYRLVDENGFFLEDVIDPQIVEGQEQFYIEQHVPQGFYHPKWNGSEWVEGMLQEQIDELKNQPAELSEEQTKIKTLEQQLKQTNEDMMAFMEVIMGGM